ncbi:adenylate cyclase-associated CAP [Xylariales sp. PMI_506]|nr:adenylate cyclase-associated CAP [Xylariales sp. PMI_506]
MYSEATLMKRLEAVAARLEDIATALETAGHTESISNPAGSLLDTLRGPVATPSYKAAPPSRTLEEPEVPPYVEEFDNFIKNTVGNYVKLSNELGGPVAEQAAAVLASFQEQRRILLLASTSTKPDPSGWEALTRPMKDAAARVLEVQENTHGTTMHSHLTCVSDGIPLLGWISIELRAFRHVDKFLEQCQYFGNKVLKEQKEKEFLVHKEWVESYYQIFRDLSDLIKDQFPLGVVWLTRKPGQ